MSIFSNRIDREKKTVEKMIIIYCKLNHKKNDLCDDCSKMKAYALSRLTNCPYGLGKPACNLCPVHCYGKDNREKIKVIMRFSGPKMIYRHPILAVYHLIDKRTIVEDV